MDRITRLTDFMRGLILLVMEKKIDHNQNHPDYQTVVDRLPNHAIFPITTPITGRAQRLDLVPRRSGNNLLLDLC